MLHSHVDNTPGTVIQITTGAMQNTSDAARDDTVLLHFEERNKVKLTEARTESRPATAKRTCSWPMSMSANVTIEYIIWMEVLIHSQPNKLSASRINTAVQRINVSPAIKRVASNFATPRLLLPCLVQRRMSSAPDW